MRLQIVRFTIHMRILSASDYELGAHKNAENKIYRISFEQFKHSTIQKKKKNSSNIVEWDLLVK